MLRMIGGTKINDKQGNDIIDGLEELFDANKESFESYWTALTSENAPIMFYYLNLKDFKLTDDLYIKMNARGKQLTSFENFKADFIGYIEEKAKEDDAWGRFLNTEKGIPIKLDTEWTDVFWRNHDANGDIDRIFFAFLNRYLLNCAIIYNDAKGTSKEWKLYGTESDDSSLRYDNGFSIYSSILSKPEFLENLSSLLSVYQESRKMSVRICQSGSRSLISFPNTLRILFPRSLKRRGSCSSEYVDIWNPVQCLMAATSESG